MTDRTWLTVYEALTAVLAASQPYDAEGGFMLLHSMSATMGGPDTACAHAASRLHLVAAIDAEPHNLDAARRSMVRLGADLHRRRNLAPRRQAPRRQVPRR